MIILRIANKIKFWRKPCLIRLLLNRYFLTRFVFYFELSVIKFGKLKSLIFFSFSIKICLLLEVMSNFVRRWDAELAVPSANAFANEVLTGPRSHYLENNANQTQRLSKFIFILQAAKTAMSFLKISPAISSQEFISSWYPHWFSCFSRRIDLARFRFGTVISYRASYWDFSSVGRAPAWAPLLVKRKLENKKLLHLYTDGYEVSEVLFLFSSGPDSYWHKRQKVFKNQQSNENSICRYHSTQTCCLCFENNQPQNQWIKLLNQLYWGAALYIKTFQYAYNWGYLQWLHHKKL